MIGPVGILAAAWTDLGIVALPLLLGLLLVIALAGLYNGLAVARVRTRNALSQIDVQMRRRHDLIPSLVETVQGFMAHERGTLEAVTRARASVQQAIDGLAA
ncbi:MAG: LemA family protein, partial [Planctomycetes bacterium]|nr:LemA family protein [Planctomycetota bacterium]